MRGARRLQGPGARHLFGYPTASGLQHELDAAGIRDVAVVVEAKDQACPLDKGQVDAFDGKTFDYFEGAARHGDFSPLYRMMWSTADTDCGVRSYAARKGIIVVGPDRVPLPSLIAAAERADAGSWLSEEAVYELAQLGIRACRPLTAKTTEHGRAYNYKMALWPRGELDRLEDLHFTASERWLDWLDQVHPLYYGSHANYCLRLIAGTFEAYPKIFAYYPNRISVWYMFGQHVGERRPLRRERCCIHSLLRSVEPSL
jgi:hypothetical protein